MCNLGKYIFFQGYKEGQASMLLKPLVYKLGNLSERTSDQLISCSNEQLDKLIDNFFDIESEEDIENILK